MKKNPKILSPEEIADALTPAMLRCELHHDTSDADSATGNTDWREWLIQQIKVYADSIRGEEVTIEKVGVKKTTKIELVSNNNPIDKGYILLPYIVVIIKTTINGEVVWYKNKWKNFLLKIKHFFVKPKYLRLGTKYRDKKIDASKYGTFKITKDEIQDI
jgi:hypothetical protein